MIRPLNYYSRQNEIDVGESLQSDVMRFMAILGLCLVAIFALVQSLPLQPPPLAENIAPVEHKSTPTPVPLPAMDAAAISSSELATLPDATKTTSMLNEGLTLVPSPEPVKVAEVKKEAKPVPAIEQPDEQHEVALLPTNNNQKLVGAHGQPSQSPASKSVASPQGLILRFSSDRALLALLAQRSVELYAWSDKRAWRLVSDRGVLSFTHAQKPKRFHNMSSDTIPTAVSDALEAVLSDGASGPVNISVTLPVTVNRSVKQLISIHEHGELIIHADGRVTHQSIEP